MDTIVYFYKKRGIKAPVVEPVGLKRYMLIRVGLDVADGRWFGETAEPEEGADSGEGTPADSGRPGRKWFRRFPGKLWEKRRLKKEKLAAARERERLAAERLERRRRIGGEVEKLAATVREYAGEDSRRFAVYEDSVRTALKGRTEGMEETAAQEEAEWGGDHTLPALWAYYFDEKEFCDYCGRFWVQQLLGEAKLPYFVILGTAPALYELLGECARGMKSLCWILTEAECVEELLDFVEEFYGEYGLAISLRTLSGHEDYRSLGNLCDKASNIIDFTEEPAAGRVGAAQGSIWLDMRSVEEKGRRIRGRSAGITYISMKEKWKYAQRRCNCPVLP